MVIVVHGEMLRTRLLSTREAARLMGLADNYQLPQNYNEAYHLLGDGVVAPVAGWLGQTLFQPLASNFSTKLLAAE